LATTRATDYLTRLLGAPSPHIFTRDKEDRPTPGRDKEHGRICSAV
jgi:hypothetical protein